MDFLQWIAVEWFQTRLASTGASGLGLGLGQASATPVDLEDPAKGWYGIAERKTASRRNSERCPEQSWFGGARLAPKGSTQLQPVAAVE